MIKTCLDKILVVILYQDRLGTHRTVEAQDTQNRRIHRRLGCLTWIEPEAEGCAEPTSAMTRKCHGCLQKTYPRFSAMKLANPSRTDPIIPAAPVKKRLCFDEISFVFVPSLCWQKRSCFTTKLRTQRKLDRFRSLSEPFIYKNDHFTETGSGQT